MKADLEKKIANNNDKQAKEELAIVERVLEMLNAGRWVKDAEWNGTEIWHLNRYLFLTAKPCIYLLNCGS